MPHRRGHRRFSSGARFIRQVDAGSCNGCEQEIVSLNNPVHDIERFGIHFVASPRHADMLAGHRHGPPVTRNMELACRKTWPRHTDPTKIVAAVGASYQRGIFARTTLTRAEWMRSFR